MVTQITQGVKVSVDAKYQEIFSQPQKAHYFFSYRIVIENQSDYTIQLLRRHWYIFDSCGGYSEVEGEGVIGQQPVISPGEKYEYESASNLTTDMGKMYGTYMMERQIDGRQFEVNIPVFQLIAPQRLN